MKETETKREREKETKRQRERQRETKRERDYLFIFVLSFLFILENFFLELLEPEILKKKLTTLTAEMAHMFVEHYKGKKKNRKKKRKRETNMKEGIRDVKKKFFIYCS